MVAAEVDLIGNPSSRHRESQKQKRAASAAGRREDRVRFQPLLHGRVYADFRDEVAYFTTAFDLILSLYQLPPNHPAVADLRESLRGPESGKAEVRWGA